MASTGHLHLRSIEGSALAMQWLERIRRCKHGVGHIVIGERLILLKQVLCCFSIQPLSLLLANSWPLHLCVIECRILSASSQSTRSEFFYWCLMCRRFKLNLVLVFVDSFFLYPMNSVQALMCQAYLLDAWGGKWWPTCLGWVYPLVHDLMVIVPSSSLAFVDVS